MRAKTRDYALSQRSFSFVFCCQIGKRPSFYSETSRNFHNVKSGTWSCVSAIFGDGAPSPDIRTRCVSEIPASAPSAAAMVSVTANLDSSLPQRLDQLGLRHKLMSVNPQLPGGTHIFGAVVGEE